MSTAEFNQDAWANIITELGRNRDKRTGGYVSPPLTSVSEEYYGNLYHGDDLAATIAELPAREMVRQWFTLDVENSNIASAAMTAIDDLETRRAVFEALVWSRVFGGAIIFVAIDDGRAIDQPVDMDNIRSIDFFHVFHRFEVAIESVNADLASSQFGKPESYRLQTSAFSGSIHASRVIRFDGVMTSKRRQRENGGWSDSLYARMFSLLRDYGLAWASIAHLFQDAAQAVFKIQGLSDALASDGDDLILNRIAILDRCRSVSRAIPLDAEMEDFKREATPVIGLDSLMDRFALRVAAAARMPATLLFGQSPGGLNATGESDIRFFYDQIRSAQESDLRPKLNRIIELIFRASNGPTSGVEPEQWKINFSPLWQLTDVESAEMRNTQSETDVRYIQTGVLTPEEVSKSRFSGDSYSSATELNRAGNP